MPRTLKKKEHHLPVVLDKAELERLFGDAEHALSYRTSESRRDGSHGEGGSAVV